MKQRINVPLWAVLAIIAIFGMLPMLSKCIRSEHPDAEKVLATGSAPKKGAPGSDILQRADKVEVFLFHATRRCYTCTTVGRIAGEVVQESYQPEVLEGKLVFREINIDLVENQALAEKFEAGGSALFVNRIRDGQDDIEEEAQVWRLTDDEAALKSYLKDRIGRWLGKQSN
jgi:hypothetical protein